MRQPWLVIGSGVKNKMRVLHKTGEDFILHASQDEGSKAMIITKNSVFSCLFRQFAVMTVISLVFGVVSSNRAGYSLWLGSTVYIIPTSCFAAKFLVDGGASAARKIVKNFYKAEVTKLLLSAVLFALVFRFVPIQPVAFFIGFIACQTVFWVWLCRFGLKR